VIGRTVSHYKIMEELGRGGMGVVYKAQDLKLDRIVALKFLPQQITRLTDGGQVISEADKARFLQEAKAASAVTHPNVCVIHDIAEHDDQQFIVMEYVEGKTLTQVVPIQKLQDAIGYAIQIGEALQEAHGKGVVHRDVKTDNIMVNTKNQIKVMDFGLAKLKGSLKLTKTSSTVGTLSYMAPEQIQGGIVDARSDIFSFGVVLYEMLTGRLPFRGEHEAAMVYSIVNEEPEPVQKYRPEVSSELIHILNRALEKDPEDRYQNVQEMVIELRRVKKETSKVSREKMVMKPSEDIVESTKEQIIKTERRISARRIFFIGSICILLAILLIMFAKKGTEKQNLAVHRQITFTGKAKRPTISPDGKFVAYISTESASLKKVIVQDLTGGRPIELFTTKQIYDMRWTPDGSEILVYADDRDSVRKWDFYLFPRLGGDYRRYNSSLMRSHVHFCWKENGSCFASMKPMTKKIYFIDKMTGDTDSISLMDKSYIYFHDLDWSPTGKVLAFYAEDEKLHTIWTITTDGKNQNLMAQDSIGLSSPRWNTQGDAIYYLHNKGQTTDLMKIKVSSSTGKAQDKGKIIQTGLQTIDILEHIAIANTFSITKDNKMLSYSRIQSCSNLWLISGISQNFKRFQKKKLTTGTSIIQSPKISPDGKKIAFRKGAGSIFDIYVMNIEDGIEKRLTFLKSNNTDPVWSPDGQEIAFNSNAGGTPKIWRVPSDGGTPRPFESTRYVDISNIIAWFSQQEILYQPPGERNCILFNTKTNIGDTLIKKEKSTMYSPRYSPDGKRMAMFWNGKELGSGIWSFSVQDTSKLFLLKGGAYPIQWSEDGKWIYFHYVFPETPDLWMIPAKGGVAVKVLTSFDNLKDVAMTPDAQKIVCVVDETQSDVLLIENFDPDLK